MKFKNVPIDYRRLTQADWDTIQEVAHGFYVEVGTFHGASACAASTNADIVHTIDIFDWKPKVYDNKKNIKFFKGTSVDYVSNGPSRSDPIDTLFIDGSHEYDSVLKDCETLIPLVKPGGIILFHDYNKDNPITGGLHSSKQVFRESTTYQLRKSSRRC